MGHKVSTISNDDQPRRLALASLAIIIAVQYAAASTTQYAFTAPFLRKQNNAQSPYSLFATASIASTIIASVPPPGSKLYYLRCNNGRGRPSSAASSKKSKRGRTDLRYATHTDLSSSYQQSSSQEDDTHNHNALQSDDNESSYHHKSINTPPNFNSTGEDFPSTHRKRGRMIKYLNQCSRLHIKLTKSSAISLTNSTDYQKRKAAWAAKYTSLSTLRSTFGSNKNRFWGDFDPVTTRKLYHTLIPRALLALHDMGLSDVDELAPLAYQARMAAKKYARERSRLPGRIGSMFYDGWRQWRRYGKWKVDGMSWEQIWDKYESQILRETIGERWDEGGVNEGSNDLVLQGSTQLGEVNDQDLTAKICLRILERSVVTNKMVDELFLKRLYGQKEDKRYDSIQDVKREERRKMRIQKIQSDLKAIEKKFDDDIRELLRHSNLTTEEGETRRKNRSNSSLFWKKNTSTSKDNDDKKSHSSEPVLSFSRGGGADKVVDNDESSSIIDANNIKAGSGRKLAVHEVSSLRILASTRRRIASLQISPDDDIAGKI